jgi:hypothetical protein
VLADAYFARNWPVVRRRLAAAGVRLASIFNSIFVEKDAPQRVAVPPQKNCSASAAAQRDLYWSEWR